MGSIEVQQTKWRGEKPGGYKKQIWRIEVRCERVNNQFPVGLVTCRALERDRCVWPLVYVFFITTVIFVWLRWRKFVDAVSLFLPPRFPCAPRNKRYLRRTDGRLPISPECLDHSYFQNFLDHCPSETLKPHIFNVKVNQLKL